jgi:hypothetical protein
MMYAEQWDSCEMLEVEVDRLFGRDWDEGSRIVAMRGEGVLVWEMVDSGGEADGHCE